MRLPGIRRRPSRSRRRAARVGLAATCLAVVPAGARSQPAPAASDSLWHLGRIQQPQALDLLGTAREPVLVAVLDRGFELFHGDLYNRLWTNPRDKPNTLDDDGNYLPDDYYGWYFSGCDRLVSKTYRCGSNAIGGGTDHAHGMSVAGLVAAEDGNKIPALGVCPFCRVLTIVHDGRPASIANAIRYAADMGSDVIVGSFGSRDHGATNDLRTDDVRQAIEHAATRGRSGRGAVLVFAAGNENDRGLHYPAYDSHVIAVGASDCKQKVWSYSARPRSDDQPPVDLVGPTGPTESGTSRLERPCGAWGLLTLTKMAQGHRRAGYRVDFGGTSGAAPIVGGVAALVLAADPLLKRSAVHRLLIGHARDIGSEVTDSGAGEVSACSPVRAALAARDPRRRLKECSQ